jgi:hypothetical protein
LVSAALAYFARPELHANRAVAPKSNVTSPIFPLDFSAILFNLRINQAFINLSICNYL